MQNETLDAPAAGEPPVRGREGVMRVLAIILALAGVLLLVFGFWGTHAAAARFGDGFVPVGASALGGLLLIAGVLIDIMAERRRKKTAR